MPYGFHIQVEGIEQGLPDGFFKVSMCWGSRVRVWGIGLFKGKFGVRISGLEAIGTPDITPKS